MSAQPAPPAAAKSFGTMRFLPGDGTLVPAAGAWSLRVEPDVAIRLKRIFPRAQQDRQGQIQLAHTDEIARDLDWVLDRYPLKISDIDLRRLQRGATAHQAREEEVLQILRGGHRHGDLVEPARPLRDYQQVAADLAITTRRLLVADELGLGKTVTGLGVLRDPATLPALVVCPPHLQEQWLEELEIVFPEYVGHMIRRRTPYAIAEHPALRGREPDVLVISYAKLSGWRNHLPGLVRTVIYDEIQELRHRDTEKYDAAAQVADGADVRVGLSATPIYNYGGEILNILSVLAPDELGTPEEFAREWCGTRAWSEKARVRDPAALGEYLRGQGLMIARTRRDVGRELPGLMNIPHAVASNHDVFDREIESALQLAELILNEDAHPRQRFQAEGNFDIRMRQATGIAKAAYVAEFTRMLLASQEKVVMWGWHRAVYDIWGDALSAFNPVMYTGSETDNAKQVSLARFIGGDRLAGVQERVARTDERRADALTESRVLMMSLRSGAGVNGLQHVCCTGVFGELDWSPQVHDQCSGRLDRDGQKHPVAAYFLHSDEGSDPVIMGLLGVKRSQSDPMIDPRRRHLLETAADPRARIREMAKLALERRRRRR